MDPKLDRYLDMFYRRLAEVGPDYIYVDDDHRYVFLGHKNTWGCACDLHLRKFAEITGRKWSRESLNAALAGDSAVRTQAWEDEHRLTACITNLSYDVADAVAIRIERPGMVTDRAYTISRTGRQVRLGKRLTAAASPHGALWKIKGPFSIFDPFIFIVEK